MPEAHSWNASASAEGTAATPAKEPDQTKSSSAARESRIAKLRDQVQEGSYRVDAAKLSKRIIDKNLRD
jgi:anti-sigma28 factor (negative regulator of flagellin synthesis)